MENMIEALNKADLWYALRQLARQVPHWKTKVNLSAFNSTFKTFFIADSIKVALGIGNWRLGIGHLGIPNNATICRSDQQTISFLLPNSQCPKQPLLNQLYTQTVFSMASLSRTLCKKAASTKTHILCHITPVNNSGASFTSCSQVYCKIPSYGPLPAPPTTLSSALSKEFLYLLNKKSSGCVHSSIFLLLFSTIHSKPYSKCFCFLILVMRNLYTCNMECRVITVHKSQL